jgi:hypothetical protein
MTPEELDEARATKAYIAYAGGTFGNGHTLATIAARIAREEEQERAKALEGLLREIEPYINFIPWFDLQDRFDALLKEAAQ